MKSDNVFEGLNQPQVNFMNFLHEQVNKFIDNNEEATVGLHLQVLVQVKAPSPKVVPYRLCHGPNGWTYCNQPVQRPKPSAASRAASDRSTTSKRRSQHT
jgi:hypothetical protein